MNEIDSHYSHVLYVDLEWTCWNVPPPVGMKPEIIEIGVAEMDMSKVFLQPGASLDTANAQITAASQYLIRQLPPGILPSQILNFFASSVPILQVGVSSHTLTEQQLNDDAANFICPPLATRPRSRSTAPLRRQAAPDRHQRPCDWGPG